MASSVRYDDVEVGFPLPEKSFSLARINLTMYAGASGDFNPIHWNERTAKVVGLPNVIAHGMLTMAEAGRVLTDWVGDPSAVIEYAVRFSKPVVVPDDDTGTRLTVGAEVTDKHDDGTVSVALTATVDGTNVLAHAHARIKLA